MSLIFAYLNAFENCNVDVALVVHQHFYPPWLVNDGGLRVFFETVMATEILETSVPSWAPVSRDRANWAAVSRDRPMHLIGTFKPR